MREQALHLLGALRTQEGLRLDPGTAADLLRLAECSEDEEQLAWGAVGLLATGPAEQERLVARCRELLAARPAGPAPAPAAGPRPPPARPAWRRRALAVALTLAALTLAVGAWWASRPAPPVEDPTQTAADPTAVEPAPELPTVPPSQVQLLEPPREATVSFSTRRAPPPPLALALGGLLGLLAGGLLGTPTRHRGRLGAQSAAARAEADRLYNEGRIGSSPYHIARSPWLLPSAVDHAAGLLARRVGEGPSERLDAAATVDRTARAGGRVQPVFEPAPARRPLLVWLDVESGDHVALDAARLVLERWHRAGLHFEAFTFPFRPDTLSPWTPGAPSARPPLGLDALARRAGGAPLLLLSRLEHPHDRDNNLPWITQLGAWPRRVLLDLEPTPLAALGEDPTRTRAALEAWGTPVLPFTEAGLAAAAAALALDEPPRRGLPPRPCPTPTRSAPPRSGPCATGWCAPAWCPTPPGPSWRPCAAGCPRWARCWTTRAGWACCCPGPRECYRAGCGTRGSACAWRRRTCAACGCRRAPRPARPGSPPPWRRPRCACSSSSWSRRAPPRAP